VNNRNHVKILAAVAAATVAVLVAIVVAARSGDDTKRVAVAASGSADTESSTGSSSPATATTSATSTTATPPVSSDPLSGFQPLWPFRSQADADSWAVSYRQGGHQPWHLDPDQTALSFSSGFLGYTEIDTVVSSTIDGRQARVAVGFVTPNGDKSTAAVIHLVRFGSAGDAPWEVVGTDDDPSLTLEVPSYGTAVGGTFQAGGHITGVDENIVVQVRQASSESAVGAAPAAPAGGEHSPWHVTVTLDGATDAVLTVAAFTGGHLQGVERFAVTAVRLS
jgi:hypothetical protein